MICHSVLVYHIVAYKFISNNTAEHFFTSCNKHSVCEDTMRTEGSLQGGQPGGEEGQGPLRHRWPWRGRRPPCATGPLLPSCITSCFYSNSNNSWIYIYIYIYTCCLDSISTNIFISWIHYFLDSNSNNHAVQLDK